MLPINTIFQGRYQIVSQIGRGGMGAVYKAIDTRLRNTVALKQMLVVNDQAARAFEREAQLLAGMRHPALPKVIDHFSEDNGTFLVMEFISGEDLGALLLKRGEPFGVADVLSWGDRLLDALEYLHSYNPPIIHRDIKPQNMKLTERGEIVLLDFGLAKGSTSIQTTQAATTGSIYGYTPHYAPLEQIQGTGTSVRSDLYALAATLHHLLTGTPPPDALTRAAARINEEPDPLQPASQLNPEVPQALAALLYQAMAQKPDQRPANAVEFRRMLRDAGRAGSTATIRFLDQPTIDAARAAQVTQTAETGATIARATEPIAAQAARTAPADLPTIAGQIASTTTITGAPATKQLAPNKRPAWVIPAIGGALIAVVLGVLVATGALRGGDGGGITPTVAASAVPNVVVGEPSATIDAVALARTEVLGEQTATAAAVATQTQVILDAINAVDSTRTAIAEATIASASFVEQTAIAQTAAILALTPTETIVPPTDVPASTNTRVPTATRDPNAPTNTPRPTATPRPSALPTVPTAPTGKAAVLAQGGGSEFRGSASVGTIDAGEGNGGSCIQGSVKSADDSLFSDFLVGIDKAGALSRVTYNYRTGFFGVCGLEAGEWGVVVYRAGGVDTSGADQGAHQVRIRLTGTPGEVVYVNFKAVNFSAPTPVPTPLVGPYDGQWSGTITGKTAGDQDFTGRFRMEIRANAIYRISIDGPSCAFETYPNVKINDTNFATSGSPTNPAIGTDPSIQYTITGNFSSPSRAGGQVNATQNGGTCIIANWSAGK